MKNKKILLFFICSASVLGVFWPTSIGGVIIGYSSLIGSFICLGSIFFVSSLTSRLTYNLLISLAIIFLLFVYTLFSPLTDINYGAIFPYISIVFLLSINLKGIDSQWVTFTFLFVSFFIFLLSFGILFEVNSVIKLIEAYYQQYYPDLFKQTVLWHLKPVSVFSVHSIASFIYFSFSSVYFYLFINENIISKKILYLVLFILFMILLPFLKSTASIALFILMIFIIIYYNFKSNIIVSCIFSAVLVFSLAMYYQKNMDSIDEKVQAASVGLSYLSSNKNGFLGRYTKGSRLDGTYKYLLKKPLLGVGFTSAENIKFGDSFISEYVIRVGIFGYLIILFLLYYFLSRNLADKRLVIPIFMFFLLADLGYPLLVTFKFVILVPLLILIFNRGYYLRNKNA